MPASPTGTYLDELPDEVQQQALSSPQPPPLTGTYLDELPDHMRPRQWSQKQSEQLHQAQQLEAARQEYAGKTEKTSSYLYRNMVPFVSQVAGINRHREMKAASDRFSKGEATPQDIDTIAGNERVAQEDNDRRQTLGGRLQTAGSQAPAMLGEVLLGGAALRAVGVGAGAAGQATTQLPRFTVGAALRQAGSSAVQGLKSPGAWGTLAARTATVPSMYVERWMGINQDHGRDPLDPRGFPAAFGMGMVHMAVLGHLQGIGNTAIPGTGAASTGARLALKGGIGVGEVGLADLAGGAAMEGVKRVLPSLVQQKTPYGTFKELVNGDRGDAMKDLAVQFLTFAAFSALHEGQHGTGQARQPTLSNPPLPPAGAPGTPGTPPGPPAPAGAAGGRLAPRPAGQAGPQPGPQPGPRPGARTYKRPIPQRLVDALGNAMEHLRRQMKTADQAAEIIQRDVGDRIARVLQDNPNPTPDDIKAALEGLSAGPIKDLGHVMAEVFFGTEKPPAGGLGGPAQEAAGPTAEPAGLPGRQPGQLEGPRPTGPKLLTGPAAEGKPADTGAWFDKYRELRQKGASHEKAQAEADQAGEQGWVPTGTKFEEIPEASRPEDNEHGRAFATFQGKDGRVYTIRVRPENKQGDNLILTAIDADGNKAGTTRYDKGEGNRYHVEYMDAKEGHKGNGVIAGLHDFMKEPGIELVKGKDGHTPEGKDFWRKQAETVSGVRKPKAAEQPVEKPAEQPVEKAAEEPEAARPEEPARPELIQRESAGQEQGSAAPIAEADQPALDPKHPDLNPDIKPSGRARSELEKQRDNYEADLVRKGMHPERAHVKALEMFPEQARPAAPEKPEQPGQPELTPPEKPSLADAIDQAEGLSDRHKHILKRRFVDGRTQEEIGNDPEMRKKDGTPLTRARINQLEAEARGKIKNNPELVKQLEELAHGQAAEDIGDGMEPETIIAERKLDPDQLDRKVRAVKDVNAQIDTAMEKLSSKFIKESSKGDLDPERQTFYEREFERLERARKDGPEREEFIAQRKQARSGRKPAAPAAAENPAVDRPQQGAAGQPGEVPETAAQEAVGGGKGGAPPPGTRKTPASAPRPEPVDPVAEAARDLAEQEGGYFDLKRMGELARQAAQKIGNAVDHVVNITRELAGQMGPLTTRLSRLAGEALARFNGARGYAQLAAKDLIEKVLDGASNAHGRVWTATLYEQRFRYARNAWDQYINVLRGRLPAAQAAVAATANPQGMRQAQARAQAISQLRDLGRQIREATQRRNNIATMIGSQDSPLQTEANYQAVLGSEGYRGFTERWTQHMKPIMEEAFRRSMGMEETDPIVTMTQMPDLPFHAKGLQDGDPIGGKIIFGNGRRGNLNNVKLRKLPFAQLAGLDSANGYDINPENVIAHSLAIGLHNAAKAEMVRTFVAEGVGMWGRPGTRVDGAVEFPEVKPPRGTQEARQGQTSLFVHEEAAKELRAALDVDEPVALGSLKPVNAIMTGAALASTVEATAHSKNLLTMMFKPGVSIIDFFGNLYNHLKGDRGLQDRLVELSRISSTKVEGGFESAGHMMSKYNPLTYAGKFLHFLQEVMRLTAEDAFHRLAQRDWVEGTETNKRNYLNQLGQYTKGAQYKVVRWLRDTGLGPFATAATNFWMQGLKTLMLDPGVKANSLSSAIKLRAEMLLRIGTVVGGVTAANFALWGRHDGDDNTPFGGLKIGEEDGRTQYLDLVNLTGLTRGLRQTGLLALLEGSRQDRPAGEIGDKAVKDIWQGAAHPFEGPPVAFAHTALTGENLMGIPLAEKARKGESQKLKNVEAAAWNANPLVALLFGKDEPRGKERYHSLSPFWKLLGPFGPKERQNPPR